MVVAIRLARVPVIRITILIKHYSLVKDISVLPFLDFPIAISL